MLSHSLVLNTSRWRSVLEHYVSEHIHTVHSFVLEVKGIVFSALIRRNRTLIDHRNSVSSSMKTLFYLTAWSRELAKYWIALYSTSVNRGCPIPFSVQVTTSLHLSRIRVQWVGWAYLIESRRRRKPNFQKHFLTRLPCSFSCRLLLEPWTWSSWRLRLLFCLLRLLEVQRDLTSFTSFRDRNPFSGGFAVL